MTKPRQRYECRLLLDSGVVLEEEYSYLSELKLKHHDAVETSNDISFSTPDR